METSLCPAQQKAFDLLSSLLPEGNVFVLTGSVGMGKTTVLRALHRQVGGAFLSIKDLVDALRPRHPLALEETFAEVVMAAMLAHDHVILDDLNLVADVVNGCGAYPRAGFLNGPLTNLATYASESAKKLIFGSDSSRP